MEEDENTISLIKDVEITDGKADTIYSALILKNVGEFQVLQVWKWWDKCNNWA